MSNFKIYHNPRCSKSRQTLALLKENNINPEIIEYLNTAPSVNELSAIISLLNIPAQDLMRKKEDAYKEADLENTDLTEKQQIELMVKYPKVIERPIVVGNGKAAIGRPPENILNIL